MSTTGTSPGWRRALRQETRETVLWPAVRVLFAGWGVVGLLMLLVGVEPGAG